MNRKVVLLLVAILVSSSLVQGQSDATERLEISIETTRSAYLTGEIVDLNFRLENKSTEDVTLLNPFSVGPGYLSVYISRDGTSFAEYFHKKWGLVDGGWKHTRLKPGKSIETSATLLWNYKPSLYSTVPQPDKIQTDYAFPDAGTYLIKSRFVVYLSDRHGTQTIESDPVPVTINEPEGEDLQVWKKIKDRGDIAYFLQEGAVRSAKEEDQEKVVNDVEQILIFYPTSTYSSRLRESLESFTKKRE